MSAYLLGSILVFLVVCLPLIFIGLMAPIADWLDAREERKKAAVAPSAGVATSSPSTPEPA